MVRWITLLHALAVGSFLGTNATWMTVALGQISLPTEIARPIPQMLPEDVNQPIAGPDGGLMVPEPKNSTQSTDGNRSSGSISKEAIGSSNSDGQSVTSEIINDSQGSMSSGAFRGKPSDSWAREEGLIAPPKISSSLEKDSTLPSQISSENSSLGYATIRTGGPTTDPINEQDTRWRSLPLFSTDRSMEISSSTPSLSSASVSPEVRGETPNSEAKDSIATVNDGSGLRNGTVGANPLAVPSSMGGFGQFPRGMRLSVPPDQPVNPNQLAGDSTTVDPFDDMPRMVTQTFPVPTASLDDSEKPSSNVIANDAQDLSSGIEQGKFSSDRVGRLQNAEANGELDISTDNSANVSDRTNLGSEVLEAQNLPSTDLTAESGSVAKIDVANAPESSRSQAIDSYKTDGSGQPQPLFNGILLISLVSNVYLVFWLKRLRLQFHDLVAAKRMVSQPNL